MFLPLKWMEHFTLFQISPKMFNDDVDDDDDDSAIFTQSTESEMVNSEINLVFV